MNFRLAYLRDNAIGRFIEETTLRTLSTIIYFNNLDIINHLTNSKNLLLSLIDKINSNSKEEKYEAILFLSELNSVSKELVRNYVNLQGQDRSYLFESLCENNFLETVESNLTFLGSKRKNKFKKIVKTSPNVEIRSKESDKETEIMEITLIEATYSCLVSAPSKIQIKKVR